MSKFASTVFTVAGQLHLQSLKIAVMLVPKQAATSWPIGNRFARKALYLVLFCLQLVSTAVAAQNRSAWMWQQASHPYGSANILGVTAKEAEVLTSMGAWGFDRIYISTGTTSISHPGIIANWNVHLDDVGIDVQFLISDFDAAIEPHRTELLDRIQARLLDYNNSRVDPREHFDAVQFDDLLRSDRNWTKMRRQTSSRFSPPRGYPASQATTYSLLRDHLSPHTASAAS